MAPGARPRYAMRMSGRAKTDSVTGRELGAITRERHAGALERWAAKLHRPHGRLAPVRADMGVVTVSSAVGKGSETDTLTIEHVCPGGTEGIRAWLPSADAPPCPIYDALCEMNDARRQGLDVEGLRLLRWIESLG